MDYQLSLNLIVGLFVGAAAGYLGSLMILRRMALVGDALSHVALPGIALALIFNLNPFFGAFGFLLLGIILIWGIETKTKLPSETVIGVIFTLSLAVGFLMVPETEALEALFGNIASVNLLDGFIAVILSVFVFFIIWKLYRDIILGTISDDLAQAQGIKISRLNLIYLLLVATVVALGIKIAGSLLMGALVIIPAAAAKHMANSLTSYAVMSVIIGIFSALGGILLASFLGFSPGPLIILFSGFIFFAAIIFKTKS